MMCFAGTSTLSKNISPWFRPRRPIFSSGLPLDTPGLSRSTMIVIPGPTCPSRSTWVYSTHNSATVAPDTQADFWPFRMTLSPSIRATMLGLP